MSGYSRNCYHGVPRIIENSFDEEPFAEFLKEISPGLQEVHKKNKLNHAGEEFENDDLHAFNYLRENRLNLNFRQVIGG